MAAQFEVYQDKKGKYRFRLKSGSGEIVLVSEGYVSKSKAKDGIASVQKNAPSDSRYEKMTSLSGKHMFNLKAANGEVIGTSEMYNSEATRENVIKNVMSNAPNASVEDLT